MAWSWSHTADAYQNAEARVQTQPREWLEVVWAEWESFSPPRHEVEDADDDYESGFDTEKYDEALAKAKTLPDDVLADAIWEKMSERATCDNGGWNAWACPYGCGCHMVSFDDLHPRSKAADWLNR